MNKNQQIAIAQFVSKFTEEEFAYGDNIWKFFPEFKSFSNESLDYPVYIETLRELPSEVKRAIVVKMMAALYIVVDNKDEYTWWQTFVSLLDMGIGSGVEAVLFNLIYNAKKYFGEQAVVQLEDRWQEMEFSDYYSVRISIPMEEGDMNITTSSLYETPFVRADVARSLIPNKGSNPSNLEAEQLVESLTDEDITQQLMGVYFNCDISLKHLRNPFCDCYSISFTDIEYEEDEFRLNFVPEKL